MYSRETEIRRLTTADVYQLCICLEPTNGWKKLMQIIPRNFNAVSNSSMIQLEHKYSNDQIRLLENVSTKQNRMATEILFDEWGTSGRKRPTLGILLDLLVRAELFRAADFVALNFLNEPPPERPTKGPAAKIKLDISIPLDTEEIQNVEEMLNDGSYPGTVTLNENFNNASSTNNNKDYFEKFGRSQKDLGIVPPSDLMEFSSNNYSTLSKDIPKFSELIVQNEDTLDTPTQPLTYSLNYNKHDEGFVKIQSQDLNESASHNNFEIPILSLLNTQESSNSSKEIIPDISVLNYNNDEMDTSSPIKLEDNSNSNRSSSSLSSNIDECNNSAPNLSILDQRSSNNDSSLTNVTETSGDNSFDMSSSSVMSNDNIPCLSALQS